MLWNTEIACEWKSVSLVQNKGAAALSAGESSIQPSGGYSKENVVGKLAKEKVHSLLKNNAFHVLKTSL